MGLFDGIKKQLLKVIQWEDNTQNTIVYKYPMTDRDEIMNGCQLVVRESQCAMLVNSGQICDVYGPGTHKLTTNNMPIITKLASWKYGFDSPFKADVYYVNTKQFINMKWGTATRISMRDETFGVIRVGARGSYSFKVNDAPTFMREIFGTNREYTTQSLIEYFKSLIVTGFIDALGEAKIPALDLPASLRELGDVVRNESTKLFDKMGIAIVNLNVESISLPENVEEAMDQRASMGILGDRMQEFTQYQTAQAIRDAANNPSGGMAAAGVGLGAGVAMGQVMGATMNQTMNQPQPQQPVQPQVVPVMVVCPHCQQQVATGAKFCSNCGTAMPVQTDKFCSQCGTKNVATAKFCVNCGQKL